MTAAPAPPPAATGDAGVAEAYRRVVAEGDLQLTLPGAQAPPPPPSWLTDFIEWLNDRPLILKVVFWAGVAALTAILLHALYRWLTDRTLRFGATRPNRPDEGWWRPDAARAAVALRDADALAAAGRYDEAAHLLLLRSVADIDEKRPGEVRPSLTARDVARLPALPADVARAFGLIAGVVEVSLFGGAAVAREAWERARAAYADAALPRAWNAA